MIRCCTSSFSQVCFFKICLQQMKTSSLPSICPPAEVGLPRTTVSLLRGRGWPFSFLQVGPAIGLKVLIGPLARDNPKCLTGKLISSSVHSKPGAVLLKWKAPLHPVFFKVLTTHCAKLAQSRLLELLWGWRDGLAIKSTYCFCRGAEFCSQHPHLEVHNYL